jgi:hypothetical protein
LYILVSRAIDESGLADVAAAGRYFQCLLGRKPASRAVAWAIQKSANAGVRPFDLALQAVKDTAKETAGLSRMMSASTTKGVAAIATASASFADDIGWLRIYRNVSTSRCAYCTLRGGGDTSKSPTM